MSFVETSVTLRAGDYVYNLATGETKLVIAYCPFSNQVTFSGNQKWVSAASYVTHVRPVFVSGGSVVR